MIKSDARKLAKHKNNQLDSLNHKIKSKIIVQKIEKHHKFKQAKVVGIYSPINNEVDINSLNLTNKIVLFPKINNKNELDFIKINKNTKWEINKFNILEPKSGKILNDSIDLLIIPALAKNNNNYRLGYGKGYYDKFIKKHFPLYTIGLVMDNLTINFVADVWDRKLNEFISN